MKVLQILNYSAPYRGNFIDSLDMIENNDIAEVENFYLFADETKTKSASWIDSINKDNKHVFYLGEGFSNNVKRIRKVVKDCNIDVVHSTCRCSLSCLVLFIILLERELVKLSRLKRS